jgi:hypothetical protein
MQTPFFLILCVLRCCERRGGLALALALLFRTLRIHARSGIEPRGVDRFELLTPEY